MSGVATAIRALTKPEDSVLIFQPVYYPFANVISNNNRRLIVSELQFDGDKYAVNFEDLENKIIQNEVKVLLFCSPHNPVGRVWTREELLKIGDICLRNNVLIVSDEIHADFIYSGKKHIPIASLSDELNKITVTCTSATKTFNIAGIQASNVVISDAGMRRAVDKCSMVTGAYGKVTTSWLSRAWQARSSRLLMKKAHILFGSTLQKWNAKILLSFSSIKHISDSQKAFSSARKPKALSE